MTKRFALSGLVLLSLTAALIGCDPNKKGADSGTPDAGSATPTKPADTATAAGAPNYKLITNGISPFWNSLSKGLDDAKSTLKVNGGW